ncbi:MAG: iron dicitrate transport regulator FecR [Bradyrhizobiaceae bacterium]|nr:MAG: iron dicitrate transport regulator FecR [Bradyrhizobiaceae bacterium]
MIATSPGLAQNSVSTPAPSVSPVPPATAPATPPSQDQPPSNPAPTTPAPSGQPAQGAAASNILPPAGDPVGNIATLTGSATVSRFGKSSPLKTDDDIYMGDTLQTGANSALSVTFTDDTTFKLSASARIVVNKYLYEEGGKNNAALYNVARGTVAFVASAVAKTGDMKIATPTATLGIRGTTGVIDVPDNVSASSDVAIKLYPDADGRVGHIEVNGRDGARLGLLSQASSGFSIRPGAGGRFTAAPLQISPQIAARDLGYVRQVHAAQGIGRQIVTRQRDLRLQNPARKNGPQRGPGNLQRPQNAPGGQRQGGPQRPQPGQRPEGRPQLPSAPAAKPGQRASETHAPPLPQRPGAQQQRMPGTPNMGRPRAPRQPGLPRRAPQGISKPQKTPKNAH